MKQWFYTFILVQIGFVTYCQNPVADFEVNIIYECGYAKSEFKNNSVNADTFLWDIDGTGYYYQTFEPRGSNIGINKKWIVTLIAKGQGLSDTLSKEIEILNTKIIFNKSIADTNSFAPLEVSFINQAIIRQGDTLTYNWDFGDGQQSNEINPQHTFIVPGTYYVNLTAIKPDGCELQYHDFVVVRDTSQKGEFNYILSNCSTKPCDFSRPHILEMPDLILNQLIERNDSLILSGIYKQNCCTKKTITLKQINDTIKIQTWEVGPDCTCDDIYYFEIVLPQTDIDSFILSFNKIGVTTILTDIIKNSISKIYIYPNPVNEVLSINLTNISQGDYTFGILDVQGKILQKGQLHNERQIQLIFSDKGIFFIYLRSNYYNKEFISKFIRN